MCVQASLDEPTRTIVLHHAKPNKLQCQTVLLAEKVDFSAYISRVFNFANFTNLESSMKFIQRKFEPLRCNTHGQHEFAKFIQRIPSKQLFVKIYTREI